MLSSNMNRKSVHEFYMTPDEKLRQTNKQMRAAKGESCMSKKVTVAKGMKVSRGEESKMKSKPGGSNVGKYKNVAKKEFAGPSGGAPAGSFPINTRKRAKAALAYAHNAPNPEGIRRAVARKYKGLGKKEK